LLQYWNRIDGIFRMVKYRTFGVKPAKVLASRLWVNSHTKNGRHIQTQSPCVRWSIRKLKRLVNTMEGSTDLPSGKRLAEAQPQGLAGATPPLPLGTGPL